MSGIEEKSTVTPEADESYFDVVREAAAEGDLLSAKRRLAQLYYEGKLVEKDDSEAVRWYTLAALQCMTILRSEPSLKNADAAFNILLELGELHRELDDLPHAISTFEKIDALLGALPDELLCAQTRRWEQIVCNRLGSLYERTGETEKAYDCFRRALDTAAAAAQEDNSILARDDLAVACYRVGFMDYLFRGEDELLRRAQEIWDNLYEETGSYDYRRKRCVIDTLYATAAPSAEESEEVAPSEESLPDSLAAELNEYISKNGYSKSGAFDNYRTIVEIFAILILAGICLWAYFSGALFELFKWLR